MRRNACLILRRRHGELVLKIMAPPVLPVVTCVRVLDVVAHPCLREFSEWPRDLV